jgi:rhodanese-related sulfurtransferase
MSNAVYAVPAADRLRARAWFAERFEFETDCWDVHEAMASGDPGFVLLDVRGPALYARGHVPGAINVPHRKITAGYMKRFAPDARYVVYCAGPHCNGSTRAALRLAELGLPVKEMPGGVTGWIDEGFALASGADEHPQELPREPAAVGA